MSGYYVFPRDFLRPLPVANPTVRATTARLATAALPDRPAHLDSDPWYIDVDAIHDAACILRQVSDGINRMTRDDVAADVADALAQLDRALAEKEVAQ